MFPNNPKHRIELPVKEPCRKFGNIFVKFEDSQPFLVYNGDTFKIISKRKGFSRDQRHFVDVGIDGIPPFVPIEDLDTIMKRGNPISTMIVTKCQCYRTDTNSFEEMRDRFYGTSSTNISHHNDTTSSDDQQTLKPIYYPESNFKKLDDIVVQLLEIKKKYLMFTATSLRETIAQQSKKMDKLCSNVQLLESVTSSQGDDQTSSSNDLASLQDDDQTSSSNDLPPISVGSPTVDKDLEESKVCFSHDSDPCIICSLQNNIFKTHEEQQKCLEVSLELCKRMANAFINMRELMSPHNSVGKRLHKALLAELRGELLLSFQIIKMQTLYASNLNKMQKLLLELSDSKKSTDSHRDEKESECTQSSKSDLTSHGLLDETLQSKTEGHRAASDEKDVETSPASSESLEKSPSKACHSSDNLQYDTLFLWRNLNIFLKCSKILVSLELSITKLIYDVLEEEKFSVPKSLENIIQKAEKILKKESVLLKHYRNPYGNNDYLAKTDDKLTAPFIDTLFNMLLPDGEGTLYSVDGRVIYRGGWSKGKMHGYGKAFMICEKQTHWSTIGEYEGNWKSNARHGFGHMVFSDGSVYDGEWEMDEIQGRGVMHRFDGCILEGHWLAGNPHGCTTFTWPHGSTEYREYRNGDILRVCDVRQDLSPSTKTLECVESAEEKTYYQNSVRLLRGKISSLKEHYEAREKQIAEERAEQTQTMETLEQASDQSKKMQIEEAEKVEELRRQLDCQICMNLPKDCLLLPCLHFNFCTRCIGQLKVKEPSLKCPTCRQVTHGEIHCRFS